ncbi:MAG: HNH endonuclease [Verrucomicrobiae bacterium]|nr:HNH endonuclease [Verrucomicrobiae bacterium]
MNSDEFFQRYPSLPSPFLVFKWSSACFHRNLGFPASESWPFPEILFRDESKAAVQAALDQVEPLKWDRIIVSWAGFRYDDCYLFGKQLWLLTKTDKNVDEDELQLLFLEAVDKDRTRFERLKRKLSGDAGARVVERRESIPEEVRIFVWRRDEGRCVKCGSQERLEFDHIIPVSRGGSNTVRNIQLLCEVCNRKKSNEI